MIANGSEQAAVAEGEMSRKEVNNEQAQWEREKKHKDALIRSC